MKNRLTVSPAGLLTTATGMSYRVLALDPNSQHMPLAVLRKIRDMVNAGAVVVGPKPIESPSLSDDEAEFKTIADQLWGGTTGKGKVLTGSIADALASLKVAADFEYTKPQADTELAFVHRKLADGDVYWVSHRNARAEDVEATFRVQGKAPELWHADTGAIEPASYRIGGRPHHRAADAAAERRGVRGVPQGGRRRRRARSPSRWRRSSRRSRVPGTWRSSRTAARRPRSRCPRSRRGTRTPMPA